MDKQLELMGELVCLGRRGGVRNDIRAKRLIQEYFDNKNRCSHRYDSIHYLCSNMVK